MKTGIFGGAFNPVHNGHVNLAKSYIDILGLDRLLIIPTANPPHRDDNGFASAEDRLSMLSLAFEGTKKAEISDIEFTLGDKSYTYNTLTALRKMYPGDEFYLIIGQDQFLYFDKWYRFRDILDMATLCTAPREDDSRRAIIDFAENTLNLGSYYLADFAPYIVSSSEIREKIKSGESITGLVPDAVEEYINSKGLYRD
jgi:nicotinate-nucleotide adenylyltransferase